ncbi:MAG: hypothetical protein GY953_34180, partial [bacterium]|nr:hypothetical protein [bacterium]
MVDVEGDGDRDLLIAGGGGGPTAVSAGMKNTVLRNLLAETGDLEFELAVGHGIAYQSWRGRHLLPLPSRDGRRLDLYFLSKARAGKNNLYLKHRGKGIRYTRHRIPGLGPELSSQGSDIPLDFNRDGRVDLLMLGNGTPQLLANRGGRFEAIETPFGDVRRVSAAA